MKQIVVILFAITIMIMVVVFSSCSIFGVDATPTVETTISQPSNAEHLVSGAFSSAYPTLPSEEGIPGLFEEDIPGLFYVSDISNSKIYISGFFTENSLKPFYYVPDDDVQDKLISQFKNLNARIDETKDFWLFEKFPLGYHVIFDGVSWELWTDGIFIRNEESESGIVRMRADAMDLAEDIMSLLEENLGILRFEPKMIKSIVSAKLELFKDGQHHEQIVADSDTLAIIEDLLSNASDDISGCPFNVTYLTLTLATGKEIVLAMASDGCPTYYNNGRIFNYKQIDLPRRGDGEVNHIIFKLFNEIQVF